MFSELQAKADAIAYKLRTTGKIVPLLIVCFNALCGFPFRLYNRMVKAKTDTVDHQSILVIRADRIGDMILATPIFKALKERYPGANMTCMASNLSSQLIENNPYIDSIIVYDPPWFDRKKGEKILRGYLRIFREVRSKKFDMAIDLRGNVFNFLFLMFIPGIRHRVSYDSALGSFLLTQAVPFEKNKHETEYFFDIIKAIGGKAESSPQAVLTLSDKDEEDAEKFFSDQNIADGEIIIALHPGAGQNRVYKRWPEENYIELGRTLVEQFGARIIVTGSQAEYELAQRIKSEIGENAVLAAGKVCHLKHLAAVLKRCRLCIGTSTGTLHVAASVGSVAIVLCGPEDPVRWHPLGNNHVLIEKEMSCRPCRENTCPHDGKCLRLITPECVMETIRPLLRSGRVASRG